MPATRRCGLFVILARDADRAVVFRRGPSRQVMLATWDTSRDVVEEGQWLKGRIYERRCDLSPDGEFLVYFAANWRKPYETWTAVSRPPWLTALALWPKGDAWGGGGRFASSRRLELNHGKLSFSLAEEFSLPDWLEVVPMGAYAGRGEDEPVWTSRLERDGWIVAGRGRVSEARKDEGVWLKVDPPAIWERPRPGDAARPVLRMIVSGIKEEGGAWYVTHHEVVDARGETIALGRSDWADWSRDGDLLFARDGQLMRLGASGGILRPLSEAKCVADLRDRVFTRKSAPPAKRQWGPRRKS